MTKELLEIHGPMLFDPMIEVFRTNICNEVDATVIMNILKTKFPDFRINFDLDDCDKILRIAGEEISPDYISLLVNKLGFECEQLY